jgi:hypothetical protein
MLHRPRSPLPLIPAHVAIPSDDTDCWNFVYFASDPETGLIKIGCTYRLRLQTRLRELEIEIGHPLDLLAVVVGDRKDEKRYHAMFRASRVHHEWFSDSQALRELISVANQSVTAIPDGAAYWGEWVGLI